MKIYLLIILWSFAPYVFAQQGAELIGESPFSAGTVGAAVGSGQSVLDASTNPALLSSALTARNRDWEERYDFVLRGVNYQGDTITKDGTTLDIDVPPPIFGPWVGYAARLNENIVWGVNLQPTVAGEYSVRRETELNIVTEDILDPNSPFVKKTIPIETNILQMSLEPHMSMQLSPNLSLGFGLAVRHTTMNMLSATEVGFDTMNGEFLAGTTYGEFFTGLGAEDFQAEFGAEASSSVPNVFFKLGSAYTTNAGATVGFWYRLPSTPTDLEGRVDVDMRDDLGVFIDNIETGLGTEILEGEAVSSFDFALKDISFPQQLGLSYSSNPEESIRFHSKAVWTNWAKSMSGWVATLSNASSPDFQDFIGGDGTIDLDMGIEWKNAFSLSLGFERDFGYEIANWRDRVTKHNQFTARAGIGWCNNPMVSPLPGLSPFNTLHVAAGLTSWANNPEEWDWHMALVFTLPDSWTSGESEFLSDMSYDSYKQHAISMLLGCSFGF